MNNMKVFLLMSVLTAILVGIGNLFGGPQGAMLFFLIAMGMNFFSYWYSDKMAIRMTGAQPLSPEEAPELYAIVRELSAKAQLPMPSLYMTPEQQPNAFATGRNPEHSAVAVTAGLVRLLDREEIAGVLAHELAHIKNRDVLIGTIAATLAGAISMIANAAQWSLMFGGARDEEEGGGNPLGAILMIILMPIAAAVIQMAISRSREYRADAVGAAISGRPLGLANALTKLERIAQQLPADLTPATAHLFIVNPLSGASLANLFSTHPPIQERVRRLTEMASRPGAGVSI
ncbi:heat shock protein [Hydrogenispora ethanolica]|uniref:Protease HtpX homolog n=1 Tax=Hydrogenispora ethanolica TaxID=1082276 RepID=A0A4R1S274_HYDET|nr:zinc metalloprotease HtpX [Hydrogenispora ethanolica]TCL72422.1 heat shock protein [Hydrogenispora ethanolica]